jgi:ethanolamine utilization protein EutQ (cupin superfamily)
MIKLIKSKEGKKRQVSSDYIINNLLTKDISPEVSLVEGIAEKHREVTRGMGNDRVYYILEGKMTLLGKNKIVAEKGDVIFISKDTEYEFEGTFKAIIVNVPAFDPKFDYTKVLS